jgi:1,4-dihydroxy-2-naphthoyl-CoA hydrolase
VPQRWSSVWWHAARAGRTPACRSFGVFAAAVESAASVGASIAVAERGQIAVGVHNATDFLRSVASCRARVVATPIQQGRVQQLWQVIITRQEDGKELARGQLRLQNIDPQG